MTFFKKHRHHSIFLFLHGKTLGHKHIVPQRFVVVPLPLGGVGDGPLLRNIVYGFAGLVVEVDVAVDLSLDAAGTHDVGHIDAGG